jgi:hypothetical protein
MTRKRQADKGSSRQLALAEVKESYRLIRDQLWSKKYAIAVVLALSSAYFSLGGDPVPELSAEDQAACLQRLSCVVETQGRSAKAACKFAVEGAARSGVQWGDDAEKSWSIDWLSQPGGGLMLKGDQVYFKNEADSELVRMAYVCQYDPAVKRAKLIGIAALPTQK